MSETFFTSDHHFGHENIIKYCKRPFSDVDEMNEAMVKRWNSVVSEGDTVYHLGDFCLGDRAMAQEFLHQLNGNIKMLYLPWHHDRRWSIGYEAYDFEWLGQEDVVNIDGQYVHLSHYPLREWDGKYRGTWHLHGHCHGDRDGGHKDYILDVGVDVHDFYPVSWEEVKEPWE